MKIPRYWAKGTVEVFDEGGRRHQFASWGWSDESKGAAEAMGQAKAARMAERILKGDRPDRYLYGTRPLREEVLESFTDTQGTRYAAITRNAYGCPVLNTANIMFVDVDLPRPSFMETVRYRVRSLLGNPGPPAEKHEADALAKLAAVMAANPSWGARVYRTRAGLRYLFTHDFFNPTAAMALQTMEMLAADPLYVQLCRAQESFRARLQPKPWRCGVRAPTVRWPWPNPGAEARFRKWQGDFEIAAQGFATCRFLRSLGRTDTSPLISALVQLHDQRTNANATMDLA